jgi:GNAT superfamily N-acetyltransferase
LRAVSASAWIAGADEAKTVARLLVAFRDHMGKTWPSENAFLAAVERLMGDRWTAYLLASPNDDSPPAGVCQLRFRPSVWTAADDCWLEDLYVLDAARGRGVGAALVAQSIALARERGCRRIELDVDAGNETALALYRGFGFRDDLKSPGRRDLFMGLELEPRG